MSRIFTRAGVVEAAMGPAPAPRVSALRPGRGGGATVTISVLAAVVAGLTGLGAGAFIIRNPALPTPAPVAVAQKPQGPATPAAVADSGPPLIIAPAPVETASLAAPAVPQLKPKPALAKAVAPHEPQAIAQPVSCETNAVGAGCRRAVIQADRHLRDVYERAVRRGVSHAVLVDYRDRWADLRQDASENPVHLIRGYGALASDLGHEARDDEEVAARRRNPTGLKALASALVPWW